MSTEIILKKLDQIKSLLKELEALLLEPLEKFATTIMHIRAAERNFQLIVELASDINTHLLIEKGAGAPDSYKQSFSALQKNGILKDEDVIKILAQSAALRNILVHEYDFDEDISLFYKTAKFCIPAYQTYIQKIASYIQTLP